MKKYRRLTRADRIAIERLLEQGKKQIEIAEALGVHRSSVSREIAKNKAEKGPYRWRGAHEKSKHRKRDSILDYSRKIQGALEELVIQFLALGLSPEQISNRLKLERAQWSVSHETIYKWIYKVHPGMAEYLRWKSRKRQRRGGLHRRSIQSPLRRMIEERPVAANDRSELGHWERDLLLGKRTGPALVVLQDRKSRYVLIRKVKDKTCSEVNKATVAALKDQTVLSSTNDNGLEFTDYKTLEAQIKAPVYFCHPYTSCERGTVENTNGLLRQYFPKGHDFSEVSDEEIAEVQGLINLRPKKVLGYRSPLEVHEGRKIRMVRAESTYIKKARKREFLSYLYALKTGAGIEFKQEMFVALNH